MAFGFARRAHVTDDQVAVAQFIAPELCLRDIHIVRTNSVIGPQETHAFVHDLENTAAYFKPLTFGFDLADFEDQQFLSSTVAS